MVDAVPAATRVFDGWGMGYAMPEDLSPALARAGLSEEEAEAQGRSVRVERGDMSGWYTARRTRERCAAYKVLIDEETDRIVGAHVLGMHAADQIGMFALAIRHGLTAHDVKTGIFVHPAAASDVSYML